MSTGPYQRARARARMRALEALARLHPDEFDGLHAAERRAEGLPTTPGVFGNQSTAECGTRSGYMRHLRRGETSCDACRAAAREYQAQRRRAHAST